MKHLPRRLVVLQVLLCAIVAACSSAGRAGSSPAQVASPAGNARPRLTAIAPSDVQLITGNVTEIALHGSQFDTNKSAPQNVVRIGAVVLRAVHGNANGTEIRVALPDAVPSGGEAPPAPWMSGRYPVTVTTPGGTSDTLLLAVTTTGKRNP
jgi:hypothetical protein